MIIVSFFRTVYWNFLFWIIMFFSQVFIPYLMILRKLDKKEKLSKLTVKLASWWGGVIVRASGSTITLRGAENIPDDHSYCIVSNHQGYFDIPVIMKVIPWTVGFVAKKELAKVPFLSIWMKEMGVVFLDRSNRRTAMDTMRRASQKVKEGQPMVIFPEGTRSQGGPVKEFKKGSLKLATLAKTRILPITVNNTYKILEAKPWGINRGDITVDIHPIIDVEQLSDEEIHNLAVTLRTTIVKPLGEE